MPVTLHTRIRPTCGPNDPIPDQRRDLEATGDTYQAAGDALQGQVAEGWIMLGVGRWEG